MEKHNVINWVALLIIDKKNIGIFPNHWAAYHYFTGLNITQPVKHSIKRIAK